ncbi:MAG: DUF3040 domain-containing protein [Ilumatobacteraceae bacterium]
MPLSEDEQRILREIEEQLHRDPNFARDLTPSAAGSRRSLLFAGIGGMVLMAVCVLLISVSPYLAFAAFVGAIGAVVMAERHLRSLGDQAMRQVAAMRRNANTRRDQSH